jgi:hypothetical protein
MRPQRGSARRRRLGWDSGRVVPDMTSTPENHPVDPETQDQDAEPSLNTTDEARPDGQDEAEDGGSTEDAI